MSLKTMLGFLLAATTLSAACIDRKHLEDASVPSEAGPESDTSAVTPMDGPAVAFEVPLDGMPGKLDIGTAIEVSVDLPAMPDVRLDVTLDFPQGPETMPDAPTDLPPPPIDLGLDNPPVPDASQDVPPDLAVLPDLGTDLPWGPEVGPDLPPTSCMIGGTPYASGAANPANPCQTCQLSSPTSWSTSADGTGCGGTGKFCSAGTCKSGCFITGTFFATGAANAANACLTCQPSSSATSWTQLGNGASCGSGMICNGGSCQTGCWIGATFIGSGAANGTNTCQICSPTKSTTSWSNNDAATAVSCGGCGGTAACTNGSLGPCSKNMQTYWKDNDGDGYGNPLVASVDSCTPVSGWVTNSGDCDDANAQWYPGKTRCESFDYTTLTTCGSDGNNTTSTCATGCAGGVCRSLATVSTAGSVTCGTLTCSTSQGCSFYAPAVLAPVCGIPTSNNWSETCDGPNDCSGGQVCCHIMPAGGNAESTSCVASGSCPYSNMGGSGRLVCDPNSPVCPSGTCQMATSYLSIYECN